jgi:DNA polymerase-1
MRRKAKAVNFGIIYGISAFGLARDIGVSNSEARRYIDSYFARYPKVRAFLDRIIEDAKTRGYVTTLLGRRRFIPELASSTAAVRSFGERTAVNTPIQGTAADLIKLAMIHIQSRLTRQGLHAKMILQVHDELVLSADRELSHENAGREEMKCTLTVIRSGSIWREKLMKALTAPVRSKVKVGRKLSAYTLTNPAY